MGRGMGVGMGVGMGMGMAWIALFPHNWSCTSSEYLAPQAVIFERRKGQKSDLGATLIVHLHVPSSEPNPVPLYHMSRPG